MRFDTISFGSAILDVFVCSPEAKLSEGEEKRLSFPYGAKCEVKTLKITSGGGGTNTAVGFSRLGLKAAVVARCGWDLGGQLIRNELKKEKVSDVFFYQLEREATDYSTILIGPDGGRTILVYRGGTKLEKKMIDWPKLNSKWFYCSSLEGNLDLLGAIVNHARKKKIKIASNPGRREIAQGKKLLKIAKNLNVFLVNEKEANQFLKKSEPAKNSLKNLAEKLPQTMIVITQGARGAWVFSPPKDYFFIQGLKVKMADSTGAGDGFGAGLIAGLAKGWELKKALSLAVVNGAAAVTQVGSKTALLKESEIDKWLARPLKIKKIE